MDKLIEDRTGPAGAGFIVAGEYITRPTLLQLFIHLHYTIDGALCNLPSTSSSPYASEELLDVL